jgi:adenylate kinase
MNGRVTASSFRAGIENMVFPKEIIFLAGAPGSGKGTMAKYIVEARDLPGVIETSALFEG